MANRALCIGINDYPGTANDLSGCINDAQDRGAALKARGFAVDFLLNDKATHQAMTKQMQSLVDGSKAGDITVITYSGHGTWVPDQHGDEPDGRDEALCPYDLATQGPLIDDQLFEIFSSINRSARLVFVSDSCHSGSVAKFAVLPPAAAQVQRVRFMPPEVFLSTSAQAKAMVVERLPARGRSRMTALTLSGCQDTEYSYDAWFNNRPNGALTYFALQALATLPANATYADWYKAIRAKLPSAQYPQKPNLTATRVQSSWSVLASRPSPTITASPAP